MNIYKISQRRKGDKKYDSAVVYAESEAEARLIHPDFSFYSLNIKDGTSRADQLNAAWERDLIRLQDLWVDLAKIPEIRVQYIGTTDNPPKDELVICASFDGY